MDATRLGLLSDAERKALLFYWELGHTGLVAARLQRDVETVRTHFRNARQKTGCSSTRQLARALSELEHTPSRGNPDRGMHATDAPFQTTDTERAERLAIRDGAVVATWPDGTSAGPPDGRRIAAVPVTGGLRDIVAVMVGVVATVAIVAWLMGVVPGLLSPTTFQN